MSMYNVYANDHEMIQMANADIPTFRPNLHIDEEYDDTFCEDEFLEMRVANIMLRQIGPGYSDEQHSLNWRTNSRHPKNEPYNIVTMSRRHHKMGPIFGTYFVPDIIETKEQFKELLPDHDMVTDRSFGTIGIIKKGDSLNIRVRKRRYFLK
jgi:hypothetical protein